MKKVQLILLVAVSGLFVMCSKEDDSSSPNNGTTASTSSTGATTSPVNVEKEAARKDYQDYYVAAELPGFSWSGDVANCVPGTLPQGVYDRVMKRIQYYRKAAGLSYTNLTFETTKNAKCQEASLMMKANNQLSHFPPTTWKCYTAEGAEAAENGNIAYGVGPVRNIDSWIDDFGDNNARVGHRRWILYSRAGEFGFGCTDNTGTLWVINGNGADPLPTNTPEFVAWPPKGYVPNSVVYDRWSFSIPYNTFPYQVDFTNATVTMKGPSGNDIWLAYDHRDNISNSYVGDNTIVWVPSGVDLTADTDKEYTVNINGVLVNGETKSYSYKVTVFKP